MLGTKGLVKIILAIVSVRMILGDALDDGKITLGDLSSGFALAQEYNEVRPLLTKEGKSQLRDEFNDLDEAEKADLRKAVKEKLNLPNETEEELTERVIVWAIETADLVGDIKKTIEKTV